MPCLVLCWITFDRFGTDLETLEMHLACARQCAQRHMFGPGRWSCFMATEQISDKITPANISEEWLQHSTH